MLSQCTSIVSLEPIPSTTNQDQPNSDERKQYRCAFNGGYYDIVRSAMVLAPGGLGVGCLGGFEGDEVVESVDEPLE